jgi:hypothetical protein
MPDSVSPQTLGRPARVLFVLAAAIGYPSAFLVAYMLTLAVPYGAVEKATNVFSVNPLIFAGLAAAIFAGRFALWRRKRRKASPQAAGNALDIYLVAHKPCLAVLPVSLVLVAIDMEGNAFGFLVLPLYLVLSIVYGIWVHRRLWRLAP